MTVDVLTGRALEAALAADGAGNRGRERAPGHGYVLGREGRIEDAEEPLRPPEISFSRRKMRKLLAALLASSVLVFGGIACDDNDKAQDKVDEDDTNFGPGDGKDEVGPGR